MGERKKGGAEKVIPALPWAKFVLLTKWVLEKGKKGQYLYKTKDKLIAYCHTNNLGMNSFEKSAENAILLLWSCGGRAMHIVFI